MRKDIERLVNVMERALKNDTCVELWNVDLDRIKEKGLNPDNGLVGDNMLSVNVYHLDSVYATQYTLYLSDKFNDIINRSESYSITKFRDKLAKDALLALRDCLFYKQNVDKVKEIFDYYSEKFDEVYKAKYQGSEFYDLICKLER